MPIGDKTTQIYGVGKLVSSSDLVTDGYNQINVTRDMVAEVKETLDSRFAGKITKSTSNPTGGQDGDIWLKMV
jgi:hypothetical protein